MAAGVQIQGMMAEAVRLHQSGQIAAAAQLYQRVLASDPGHADALHLLGLAALQSGQAEQAVGLIGKAISLRGREPSYHFHLALALQSLGALDEAEASYRRVLSLKPNDADTFNNLGNVLAARGRNEEAVACLRRVLAIQPSNAGAMNNLGSVLSALGRSADAEAQFRKAAQLAPDQAEVQCNLGNALRVRGQLEEAIACFRKGLAAMPDHSPSHNSLGLALWEMGQREEALAEYRKALTLTPDSAEALTNLGIALWERGELDDAHTHLARAVELWPSHTDMLNNLARLLATMGRTAQALEMAGRSLNAGETPVAKHLFVDLARRGGWTGDNAQLRPVLVRALSEPWDRPGKLTQSCAELIKRGAVIGAMVARANDAWPQRLDAKTLLGDAGFAPLAGDALLMALLTAAPNADMEFERFLTNARAAVLETARGGGGDDKALAFAGALAQQCFINEYVFLAGDGEAEAAAQLRNAAPSPLAVLAAACYAPLVSAPPGAWPQEVRAVLTQQVDEPAEEKRLAAGIARLTRIEDEVSRLVQSQYEENPYPRWVRVAASAPDQILPYLANKFPSAAFDRSSTAPLKDILIAGCGTGQQSISRAQKFPSADILAVDLSLASLAYAKRKSGEYAITNTEYAQGDILELGTLERKFDVIESIGVLHHMQDPYAAWGSLLPLLRPKGFMWLGFYSQIARVNISAARDRIAQAGIAATPDDIRRFRQELPAMNADGLFNSILGSDDFYSVSGCRDLLFHAQEQRLTLRDIAAFLKKHGLIFLGFEVEEMVRNAYRARFPADEAATDVETWAVFEEENPRLFASMYVFWVQKP